jgi:acyl-CoA synthetase (AMP-forming)/AMP-acid ligase II
MNSDYYAQVRGGVNKCRAILVPFNWRLDWKELREVVADAEIQMMFVSRDFADHYADVIADRSICGDVIIVDENGEDCAFSLWRDQQDDDDPNIMLSPEDVDLQLYTSGTTGVPKGVMLSNATLYQCEDWNGTPPDPDDPLLVGTESEYDPDESLLAFAPNFHLAGNVWYIRTLRIGTTLVLLPKFDFEQALDHIGRYRVAKIFMVPAMLQTVVEKAREGADFRSLNLISYGAAPIAPDLMREAVELIGCRFSQTYGMTEIGDSVTVLEPTDFTIPPNPKMKSVGRPRRTYEVKIVDPETRGGVPVGRTGEIAIRTPHMMNGYYKNPVETAKVLDAENWYYSGDIGCLDEDGYLYILDRLKDMIISGGENIYSAEVEAALHRHSAVLEAAVIGIPSEQWGEAVKAFVVIKPGSSLLEREINDFMRGQIAAYKCPKSYAFIDALPRNGMGKLLKHELRERSISGGGT